MSSKKICTDALETFGAERQIKKCLEELNELAVAIHHYSDGKDTIAHVAEEIADVEITLQQMTLLWSCQTIVEEQRGRKLQSLRQKILLARLEGDASTTIADKIRAMSDEELAQVIYQGISSDACDYCKENNRHCTGRTCQGKADAKVILEWLRKPAEEVKGDG